MTITDDNPLLLHNLLAERGGVIDLSGKAVTSPANYLDATVRTVDGYGSKGAKPRPFNQFAAVRHFASWMFKAVNLNANAVARIPLREYVKRKPGAMYGDYQRRAMREVLEAKGVTFNDAACGGLSSSRAIEHEAEIADRAAKMFRAAQVEGKACLWKTRACGRGIKSYFSGESRSSGRVGWSGALPSKTVALKVAEWDGEFEEVTERTPMLDVLCRANPWLNGFGLTQIRIIYLLLTGNTYTHKVLDAVTRVPAELWPMPSQCVSIKPDKEKFISGYVYGTSRENEREFPPDEVIHSKLPNPTDPYYGRGKVEAAWTALGLHTSKRVMDQAKFDNMNRPDWMIIFKNKVQQEALTRLETGLNEKFQGPAKSGKVMAFGGGDATIQALNQELAEIGDADRIVEEIAAVCDTPVSMLKANDPNRSSAQTADTAWLRDSVRPLAIADEEDLNAQFVPDFDGEADTFLAYDPVSFEDETTIVRNAAAKLAAGITIVDESREECGYKPIGGVEGNMRFMPSGATGSVAGLLGNLAPGQSPERTNENGATPGASGLPPGGASDGGAGDGEHRTSNVEHPTSNAGAGGGAGTGAGEAKGANKEFLQQVYLAFLKDGTVNDVMANMTDLRKLTDEVGIPRDQTYIEPYLPVVAAAGPLVSGDTIEDPEGDVVGGDVQPPPDQQPQGPRPERFGVDESDLTITPSDNAAADETAGDDAAGGSEEADAKKNG